MDKNIERRYLDMTLRAVDADDKHYIEGDAAVFGKETVIGSWFREMIRPGAFSRVLSEKPDVVAAYNHDWNIVLGRTTAGTLELEQTEKSLRYKAEINPNDPDAMSVYQRVKRGDINQASFAFTVRTEEWEKPENKGDLALRTVIEVDQLFDVGPVTFGAYPEASAQARSKADEYQKRDDPTVGQEPAVDEMPDTDPQEQVENERRRLEFLKFKYLK